MGLGQRAQFEVDKSNFLAPVGVSNCSKRKRWSGWQRSSRTGRSVFYLQFVAGPIEDCSRSAARHMSKHTATEETIQRQ